MSDRVKEILMIDDDEGVVWVVQKAVASLGCTFVSCGDAASGLKALGETISPASMQVVLLDLVLPDASGLDVLGEIKTRHPDRAVIVITAHGRMESAVEAMKLGAFDYLGKPFDVEELKIVIQRAWSDMAVRDELGRLRAIHGGSAPGVGGVSAADAGAGGPGDATRMMGKSRKMLKVFKDIGRVAAKDVSVLISGESGTGKELVAGEIHSNSVRKSGPFVAINVASIPRELLESELFGWKKGAFSGAVESRAGCIASAQGGTLLLDEISEMDLKLQAKILRFLQEMEYTPLGSSESVKADVRILCATNRRLREETAKGNFREDLFYRLNVIEIKLPPLREREGDVLELAARFLQKALIKYEIGHKEFSEKTRRFMLEYHWPGNVRELQNAVKRAAILSETNVIETKDLVLAEPVMYSIRDFLDEKLSRYIKEMTELEEGNLYGSIIGEVEKALISIVMKETGGNQLKAAKTLGINRNTLRARIKTYGL